MYCVLLHSKANDWYVCFDYGEKRILCFSKTLFFSLKKVAKTVEKFQNIMGILLHHMVWFISGLWNFIVAIPAQQMQSIFQLRS